MSSPPTSSLNTKSQDESNNVTESTDSSQNDQLDNKDSTSASTTARTSKKRTAEEAGLSFNGDTTEDDEAYDAGSDTSMSDREEDVDLPPIGVDSLSSAVNALTISGSAAVPSEEDEDTDMVEAGWDVASGYEDSDKTDSQEDDENDAKASQEDDEASS